MKQNENELIEITVTAYRPPESPPIRYRWHHDDLGSFIEKVWGGAKATGTITPYLSLSEEQKSLMKIRMKNPDDWFIKTVTSSDDVVVFDGRVFVIK